MTPILITVKNGKARPKNPYKEYIRKRQGIPKIRNSVWISFESTVQWDDCPGCEDGEYEAYLQWQVIGCSWYDVDKAVADRLPNHSRQVWRIVSQELISDHKTYVGMKPEIEKEEAKTVEGKTPEEIIKKEATRVYDHFDYQSGNEIPYLDISLEDAVKAMQSYSSQQNTELMEENARLREVLESFVNDRALGYIVMTDFMIYRANEALKPKQ